MKHSYSGFTLVELAIVVVIIALLAGGIFTARHMLEMSYLRSIIQEKQEYVTAVVTFRGKYKKLPGDMNNATGFWGKANAIPATCITTLSTGKETCDGNGDGRISDAVNGTEKYETFRFWQHLANADIIKGRFSGVGAGVGFNEAVPNQNVPQAKYAKGSGFGVVTEGIVAAHPHLFPLNYKHVIYFGKRQAADQPKAPALTAENAYSIDSKFDDGKPGTGEIMAFKKSSIITPNCVTDDNPAAAVYDRTSSDIRCNLLFPKAF